MFDTITRNPFVELALDVLTKHEGNLSEELLSAKLELCEPVLSPLNRKCVAVEALRQHLRQLAERKAQEAQQLAAA